MVPRSSTIRARTVYSSSMMRTWRFRLLSIVQTQTIHTISLLFDTWYVLRYIIVPLVLLSDVGRQETKNADAQTDSIGFDFVFLLFFTSWRRQQSRTPGRLWNAKRTHMPAGADREERKDNGRYRNDNRFFGFVCAFQAVLDYSLNIVWESLLYRIGSIDLSIFW